MFRCQALCAGEFGLKQLSKSFHISYTHKKKGLKSCLVKVSSRSVENCRFWSTLKIVDFKHILRRQALCAREFGMKQLSLTFQIYSRMNRGLHSCLVKVLSGSVENCRFWNTLKIVDLNIFTRCLVLCARECGMKELSERFFNLIHILTKV